MHIQRAFMNVLCEDPQRSRRFYQALFDLRVEFESLWFIHLVAEGKAELELGLLLRTHEVVPEPARGTSGGHVLSIVVEDVDALVVKARELEVEVLEEPRDLFYGQRRALLRDPDGVVIDLSSPCAPDPAWAKGVRAREGGGYVEGESQPDA